MVIKKANPLPGGVGGKRNPSTGGVTLWQGPVCSGFSQPGGNSMPYHHIANITVQSSYGPAPHRERYKVLATCICGTHFDFPISTDDQSDGIKTAVFHVVDHIVSHVNQNGP